MLIAIITTEVIFSRNFNPPTQVMCFVFSGGNTIHTKLNFSDKSKLGET